MLFNNADINFLGKETLLNLIIMAKNYNEDEFGRFVAEVGWEDWMEDWMEDADHMTTEEEETINEMLRLVWEESKKPQLKLFRETKGLSQCQLANLSGVSVRMIQKYEQGLNDLKKAQVDTVNKLSRALGCRIEHLI